MTMQDLDDIIEVYREVEGEDTTIHDMPSEDEESEELDKSDLPKEES